MHVTIMHAPLRTTMLGSSRFSCGLAPFVCTGSTTSFTQQSSGPRAKQTIRKQTLASSFSTKCVNRKESTVHSGVRTPQHSLRRENMHQASSFSPQISITISFKRNFNGSATACESSSSSSTTRAALGNNQQQGVVPLDWNTFFQLRTSRRRYSLVSSVLASIASTAIGVQVLSAQNIDTMGAQVMGLDPFIVLGLATAACGALGWLTGPILGNAVWGLVYRRYRNGVATKEKEFFNRIKRYRVDPSANSIANPVPDYYGEKIGSVQGYRQWLKDQRAYNRKKARFIL